MATTKTYIEDYLVWREANKREELTEREERTRWYKQKMGSQEKIKSLTEDDLHELMEKLWALGFWKNKAYKVNKLIKDNGIDKIKNAFVTLLHSDQQIAERWDRFRQSVKGFGPSSLSEILTLVFPNQYGIMNMKPLTVLPALGFLAEDEVKKISCGYTSGSDYERFMRALQKVRDELIANGLPKADFIDVDFFIWYLFEYVFKLRYKQDKSSVIKSALGIKEDVEPKPAISLPGEKEIKSHPEAECILLQLGQTLGYDTYSPDKSKEAYGQKLEDLISLDSVPQFTTRTLMETIKYIDVIWFQDEFPVYCFEVEHTTGVTEGLLRLYRTSPLSNAKLFIIAPSDVLKKFETEVNKIPFSEIKKRYIFRSYNDLMAFCLLAKTYTKSRKDFFMEE